VLSPARWCGGGVGPKGGRELRRVPRSSLPVRLHHGLLRRLHSRIWCLHARSGASIARSIHPGKSPHLLSSCLPTSIFFNLHHDAPGGLKPRRPQHTGRCGSPAGGRGHGCPVEIHPHAAPIDAELSRRASPLHQVPSPSSSSHPLHCASCDLYSFRFGVCNFMFFGDTNVLCNMC